MEDGKRQRTEDRCQRLKEGRQYFRQVMAGSNSVYYKRASFCMKYHAIQI